MKDYLKFNFFDISSCNYYRILECRNGNDLEKLEKSFGLPCDEIGNDDCISRVFGVGAYAWIFGIKKERN